MEQLAAITVPEDLNPLVPQIVELTLQGLARNEIAAKLEIHPTRVWQLRQTPEYRTLYEGAIADTMTEVRESFKLRAKQAADQIYMLSQRAESEKVKLSASQDVLDRTGEFNVKREVGVSFDVKLDAAAVGLFLEAARELGPGSATPILERYREVIPVLPHEGDPGALQADGSVTQGSS